MSLLRHGRLAAAFLATLGAPALAAPPEVAIRPATLLLGTGAEAQIEVRTPDAQRLRAAASVGTLSAGQRTGPDTVRFTYAPPGVRYPHTAILLFWVERGADPPELTVLRLPLIGRTELEVNTEPRADVRVEVKDRTFGPRRADAKGHAVVPVEVPPGVTEVKVLSVVGGVSKALALPLPVPPGKRLAVVGGPSPLPRAGGWAWLVSLDRLDYPSLQIDASGGSAGRVTSLDDRALIALRPSAESLGMSVTFRTGSSPDDQASVELEIEEPPLARPHALKDAQLVPGMLLGGSYGGGSNLSLLGSVEVGASFPLLGTAFAAGVALEGNALALSSQVPGLEGRLDSTLLAFSPLVVARYQVFTLGAAALHLRAGAGPLLFVHQIHSDFEPTWSESGVALSAFGGAEISYRVGLLDMLLEVRWAYGQVHTNQVDANIGGMVLGFGARIVR
ncbi:MAG TPA: hypothetical protein VIG99_11105 [Myxococcaceae bacterium]|jgi:hypothetical protein